MRSLFGLSQDALLLGLAVLAGLVVVVLGIVAWRNPLLPRLAWRNLPRRPGFAALVRVPAVIVAYHVSYGIGTLLGGWDALRHGRGRTRFSSLTR